MSNNGLFDEFPEISAKAWKQKIQFDLQGADYNNTLVWESPESIRVKPFYHADDITQESYLPPPTNHWNIGEALYVSDAEVANKKAMDALEQGVESLVFTIPNKTVSIEKLLAGINLNNKPLHFNFQFLSLDYLKNLKGILPEETHCNIDIIGHLARSGNWFFNLKKDHERLQSILKLNNSSKNIHTIGVDTSLYQNAGANMVQQLAYAMAHANEYLNHFYNETSIDTKKIDSITFKVTIGSNYFFEIAKLKALRILWNCLASAYNITTKCHILAFPSKRNKTLYGYNTNMLRTTTECMAAILGGADTLCNLPYDFMYHKDNVFGTRMARNQLLVLKNESHFKKVGHATEGTYYIESLTQQLAEKALGLFKNIESSGGFLKQLKKHTIQQKIKESAQKEQEKFNLQEEVLVGANKYQNKEDKMKDTIEIYPFVKNKPRKTLLMPIIEKRLAEPLEQNRLKGE